VEVRTKKVLGKLAMLFVAGCFATSAGRATTLARLSLDDLARAATLIVRARCTATSSRWEGGTVWTFAEFDVSETFKGSAPQRVTVRLPGGQAKGITVHVEGAPRFTAGEEGVLFLEKTRMGDYAITAWTEGTFRLRRDAQTGRETVTQDSAALAIFDPATRQFRGEGLRNLSLDEFRSRLTAALSRQPGTPTGGSR
jgi:hypothetical protein